MYIYSANEPCSTNSPSVDGAVAGTIGNLFESHGPIVNAILCDKRYVDVRNLHFVVQTNPIYNEFDIEALQSLLPYTDFGEYSVNTIWNKLNKHFDVYNIDHIEQTQ